MVKASDLKPGDIITIGGEKLTVLVVEVSDTSKQGAKKCRVEAKKSNGEKVVLVRPADYPLN